jgi:hypothetical protein
MITPDQRAELRRLRDAATPGEWLYQSYESGTRCVVNIESRGFYEHHFVLCKCCPPDALHWVHADHDEREQHNLSLIAAAVNALLPLLDALDAVEKERDEARDMRDRLADNLRSYWLYDDWSEVGDNTDVLLKDYDAAKAKENTP